MPEGNYGWMQQTGELKVRVGDSTQVAFADFGPNWAKLQLASTPLPRSEDQNSAPARATLNEDRLASMKIQRLSLLPPLLIETGAYCALLKEARDVFVDGHFYACVAMCGISFERFQRDKAAPFGATDRHKAWEIREILKKRKVLPPDSLTLCKKMADLRNSYAHGHGKTPEKDALTALGWMHSFIDNETTLMRNYEVVDGVLCRRITGATR